MNRHMDGLPQKRDTVPAVPNLSDGNRKVESPNLSKLEIGEKLFVFSQNTKYTLERRQDGLYISGHPKNCPVPTKVEISCSYPGMEGSSPYLLLGMELRYKIDGESHPRTSTRVLKIEAPEKV